MTQLDLIARSGQKRVISYGGGLDSFAMLVRAIELKVHVDAVAFCDVGDPDHIDPAEWPGTYRHIREVAEPMCRDAGIPFVWISSDRYPVRDARSLFAWMKARGQIPIAGPKRICTTIAKVERFEAWARDVFPGAEVEVWIGFEAGEEARAAKDPNAGKDGGWRKNRFPLIEWGMCRCRCEAMVRLRGYPVPRKSACTYCPYGTKGDWQTLQRELPATFDAVAQLEADKPPTAKNGKKLSIMGYRTLDDGSYRAPPLPEFVKGTYRPLKKNCNHCGLPRRSKAVGCGYLGEQP